jgi:hypothetical protein
MDSTLVFDSMDTEDSSSTSSSVSVDALVDALVDAFVNLHIVDTSIRPIPGSAVPFSQIPALNGGNVKPNPPFSYNGELVLDGHNILCCLNALRKSIDEEVFKNADLRENIHFMVLENMTSHRNRVIINEAEVTVCCFMLYRFLQYFPASTKIHIVLKFLHGDKYKQLNESLLHNMKEIVKKENVSDRITVYFSFDSVINPAHDESDDYLLFRLSEYLQSQGKTVIILSQDKFDSFAQVFGQYLQNSAKFIIITATMEQHRNLDKVTDPKEMQRIMKQSLNIKRVIPEIFFGQHGSLAYRKVAIYLNNQRSK